ncbi:YggT family protein [Lysinibacillus parviboronicapiens]|uniref:YggT family protein n=1 Tax=Lysinibacillus parviboronicapiens TaxID=436516 RepID=A0ABV2PEB0_9BACI|nr:YggT family protein [Lysinibacillus parviboronicapiens]
MTLYVIMYYVSIAFKVYSFMLVAYILMSWIPAAQNSSIGRMLEKVCEPYLGIFRKFIPPIGMIDISPIVAIFLLNFIQNGLFIVIQKIYLMF